MKKTFTRREVLAAGAAAATVVAWPTSGAAQGVERKKVTIAVGGKNLLYYLPLTIAEQKKFFEEEGLEVTIVDFAGGARALQAVVGGSADVVSGAFEHNINMQAKGQPMRAFVLQGRAPQIALGVSTKTMPNYKTVADLKGKKIGVTAPGSSTNILCNFVLAKAGLKPSDVSYVGVGASQGAVAALRAGQIDAISNLDPVITNIGALQNMFDVERVEILRGPQGTLYGKNTTAGAVNITTRAPTFDFSARAEASVGKSITMKRFHTRGRGKSTRSIWFCTAIISGPRSTVGSTPAATPSPLRSTPVSGRLA